MKFYDLTTGLSFFGLMLFTLFLLKLMKFNTHLLVTLLVLEYVGVSLLILLSLSVKHSLLYSSIFLVMLTFMVCEASVGLGLLISNARQSGSELMSCYSA